MSSLVRRSACAQLPRPRCSAERRARSCSAAPVLPPVGLPVSDGEFARGRYRCLQNILAQPSAQQAISPTLDTVSGVPEAIADSGAPNLLAASAAAAGRTDPRPTAATVENDGNGLPVRRGIVAVLDPDPAGHPASGWRGFPDRLRPGRSRSSELRSVSLAVPPGMSAKGGSSCCTRLRLSCRADFDHLFEPAGGALAPDRRRAGRGARLRAAGARSA